MPAPTSSTPSPARARARTVLAGAAVVGALATLGAVWPTPTVDEAVRVTFGTGTPAGEAMAPPVP